MEEGALLNISVVVVVVVVVVAVVKALSSDCAAGKEAIITGNAAEDCKCGGGFCSRDAKNGGLDDDVGIETGVS